MNDKDAKTSSGTTAIVIVVAVLILGIPCIAGVLAVFGVGFFFVRSGASAPDQPPPQVMSQPLEPTTTAPVPVESAPEPTPPPEAAAPSESTAPAPPEGK